MAAEVVGTAFVRIRALTKGLSKDIEKAVNKAVADADFSKASKKLGETFSADASEHINKGLKDSVENVDIDGSKAGTKVGETFSDGFGKKVNERLSRGFDRTDLTGTSTRLGGEAGTAFQRAFDNRLAVAKKFKFDPQIVRNTTKDFDNLFAQEEASFGQTITRFFSRTFDRVTPDVRKKAGGTGASASKSFGDRFVQGLKVAFARLIPILTPTLASITSFLVQYVVALAAQVSLLVEAAAGGIVALGVAGAAVGTAILPLIAAFKVDTKRLERFKKVGEDVGKAWRTFGIETQKTLLPALSDSLRMTKKLIPVFSDYGEEIGLIVGQHVKWAAAIITGEEGQRRFAEIFKGSTPIVENFLAIIVDLGDIISNLFIEALPVAQQFSIILADMVDRWKNLVQVGSDNGTIAATFQDWFDKSRLVFGALGDIAVAIGNIIAVGSDSAVPFFQNFADFADRFRTFTESAAGQNKIKQIFDDALEVAHSFNDLIIEIGERIGGGIFEAGGNEGLIAFLDTLRLEVVPFLDEALRPLIEDLGPQLTAFFIAFADVLTALGESGAIEVTVQSLTLFTEAMTALLSIPGMDTIAGTLLGIAGAFGVLKLIGITDIAASIAGLVTRLAGLGALSTLGSTITATFTAAGGGLAGIGAVITGVAAPILLVVAAIAAVIAIVALLVIHWDKVKEAFNATVRFFKDPMARLTQLKENIEDLLGTLKELGGKALGAAGRGLARFGGVIKEKLEDALGAAGRFASRLPGMIGRALLGLAGIALRALGSFGRTVGGAMLDGLSELPGLLRAALVGAINLAFQAVFLWITGIPTLLIILFQTIGPAIGAVIADAFGVAVRFVTETLPRTFTSVLDFFTSLPGRIFNALLALGSALLNAFSAAWRIVTGWLTGSAAPAVLDFFTKLPGRIVGAIVALPGLLRTAFQTAMDAARTVVSTVIDGIVDFFVKLPGRITALAGTVLTAAQEIGGAVLDGIVNALGAGLDFAGDVASAVTDAVKEAINALIRFLNDALPDSLGKGPLRVNLPDDPIPELAMGGIFDKPTFAQIAEAGREVVIPLTKPARAAQLARESGLLELLSKQQAATSFQGAASAGPAGPALAIATLNIHAADVQEAWEETNTELRALARGARRAP